MNVSPTNSAKSSSPRATTLPVSLEDQELFPRTLERMKDAAKLSFDQIAFQQMHEQLSRIWWSRLIIATRGYVLNLAQDGTDATLFVLDDAFIHVHRCLVEEAARAALELMSDLDRVDRRGVAGLAQLAKGVRVTRDHHPWLCRDADAYTRLLGAHGRTTYAQALRQTQAYLVFFEICCRLQARWRERQQKTKSVVFREDPEWQPDDRVVLFQQFYKGNRTWVLLDFDRHVLACWRPRGVHVIFGERYLQRKLDDGFALCARCGMLESMPGDFPRCPQGGAPSGSPEGSPRGSPPGGTEAAYCSKDCLLADERQLLLSATTIPKTATSSPGQRVLNKSTVIIK